MLAQGTTYGNGAATIAPLPGWVGRVRLPFLDRPLSPSPASFSVLTQLRSLGAARALLLLAIIALLSHFIADSGLWRAAKTSRFDFSGAICSSAKHAKPATNSTIQRVTPVKPAPAQHHAGGECCDLCCGAGAAPLAGTPSLDVPSIDAGTASPIATSLRFSAAPQWAPQAARAPPASF